MRLAVFGGRYKAIAFALGLAGAVAACGGDDTVSEGTGGSGGTSVSDSGKGGGTGGDAAPDRAADARADAAGGSGGAGGADASPDRGTGGVDASPDTSVVPDAAPDVARDVTPDQVADARVDVVVTSDASDGAPRVDVVDGGGGVDVVSDRGPDVTPVPDTGPDVVVPSDAGPDVAVTSDASDAARTPDAAADASDAGNLEITPGNLTWDPGPGTTGPAGDGGPVTWTAVFSGAGDSERITASFDPPLNWFAYSTLVVHINVVSGLASVADAELALQGDGDASAVSNTETPVPLTAGEQDLFLNIGDVAEVQGQIGSISVVLNSVADAGQPGNTVVEILSIEAQP